MSEQQLPKIPPFGLAPKPYQPVNLVAALNNPPKDSTVKFEGIGNSTLRFHIPQREIGFVEYISVGIIIAVFSFLGFLSYVLFHWVGELEFLYQKLGVTILCWAPFVIWLAYEINFIRSTQIIDVSIQEIKIIKKNLLNTNEFSLKMREIKNVALKDAAPFLIYYNAEKNKKETSFAEYARESDQEWIFHIVKTIQYNSMKIKT